MEKIWVVFKNQPTSMGSATSVPMSSAMASASAAELRSVLLELSAEAQGRLRQLLDPDGGVPAASKSPMPDWRCLWAGNVRAL